MNANKLCLSLQFSDLSSIGRDGEVKLDEVAQQATQDNEAHRHYEHSRIEMMRGYAELHGACRREYLLNSFGEDIETPCGYCDNCDAGLAEEEDNKSVRLIVLR